MRRVYTGGTFDLFHSGHVNLLKQCKKIAGKKGTVIVSLNTDEFITRFKGKPPIMSLEERFAVVEACKYVDEVVINFDGEDSTHAILASSANFVVIGSDWASKDYYKQMGFTQEWLDGNDISLIYVPYTQGISTTELKKRIGKS